MALGVEHIGHVAMAAPSTGFVNRDPSHLRLHEFLAWAAMLPESDGHCRHRHLAAQQHDEGLKKQRKPATFPRPGYRHAQDPVLRTIAARHPRFQEATHTARSSDASTV
jgi:hypothetical protein